MPFHSRTWIAYSSSRRFHHFRRELGVKGIWAETRAEFEEIWARLDAQGYKVLAQEYVPGSSSDHYFIDGFRDRDGNLKAMFARRRRRIYPPDFGNSSYCESIRWPRPAPRSGI
jgi:predicted ATP-grasp superfamily ATP-dependent carboligase